MASDVVIRDVVYSDCPEVDIPIQGGGTARFMDTSDATLNNGNKMLSGNTAYANGTKYTGTIQTKTSGDVTVSGATVTAPAGYYASAASGTVASGSVTAPASISGTSASVSAGTNTLTLTKSISVTPTVSTEGYITSGTAGNSSVSLTASVATKGSETFTPGTSDQEIASGTYLTGKQTISGDTNLASANIVSGVSIFGVAGSAKVPVISQDATTKVLSIS